jgi:septal ring factor EnvC (AmiA/AmiB activator)
MPLTGSPAHPMVRRLRRSLKVLAAMLVVLSFAMPLRAGDAGESDDIKSKQAQLDKIRKEISDYEDKIKERESKETATLELLDEYDKQADLVRKLIRKLKEQQDDIEKDIDKTKASIRDLGGRLTFLKRNYAQHVAAIYKNGTSYDLELLFSSASFNQLLVRSEYLKRFSEQRKADLDKIVSERDDYQEDDLRLQKQLTEERQLLSEKAAEEKTLAAKMERRKQILASIRKDKKSLKQEVNRKVAAASELEGLITRLIDEARKKKEAEEREAAERAKEGKAPVVKEPPLAAKQFNEYRGRLRWPVDHGTVVARFGQQENRVLHTVTQNTGIDIKLPVGSDVSAIAPGDVSAISWLPSFGNLVILDHSNGFRTVYAHLSEVTVTEGQRLAEGATIGKSGEALSGPMLHFEIWKDRDKQDPETWLSPRGLAKR